MSTTQPTEISQNLYTVLSAAGASIAAVASFLWKPYLRPIVRRVAHRLSSTLSVQDCFRKDATIIQLLSELRATTGADRIALCQFQNGEHFSSNMVGWKSTVTHEVHAMGIEPTLGAYQQILASRLYDVFKLMFDEITNVRENGKAGVQNRDFIICKMTDELPPSFARYSIEIRGVKKFTLAPVFKDYHGIETLCGFIRLEYCGVNAHRCAEEKNCQTCELRKAILETARMVEMEMYARGKR